MPVYKNVSNVSINLDKDNKILKPGETISTEHFYDIGGLQLISMQPYVSPVEVSEVASCSQTSIKDYYVLDKGKISIVPLDGDINLHLNEYPSNKVILLKAGLLFEFSNSDGYIHTIYYEPVDPTATVQVYTVLANKYDNII